MLTRTTMHKQWRMVLLVLAAGCILCLPACDWFSKPDMPVEITYRQSLVGQGYVLQFHNTSTRLLRVAVRIRDSATGQVKELPLEMPGGKTAEIGWLEGWKFVSGDQVTVRHEEYADKLYLIP